MTPTKEELDQAINFLVKEFYQNTPGLRTALTILTAYRDGEMVEKNQWISVKDRLPKEFEIVIIPGGIGYYTKEGWFTITHESYPKLIQWPVLLWQPLPTPPTEPSNETK